MLGNGDMACGCPCGTSAPCILITLHDGKFKLKPVSVLQNDGTSLLSDRALTAWHCHSSSHHRTRRHREAMESHMKQWRGWRALNTWRSFLQQQHRRATATEALQRTVKHQVLRRWRGLMQRSSNIYAAANAMLERSTRKELSHRLQRWLQYTLWCQRMAQLRVKAAAVHQHRLALIGLLRWRHAAWHQRTHRVASHHYTRTLLAQVGPLAMLKIALVTIVTVTLQRCAALRTSISYLFFFLFRFLYCARSSLWH